MDVVLIARGLVAMFGVDGDLPARGAVMCAAIGNQRALALLLAIGWGDLVDSSLLLSGVGGVTGAVIVVLLRLQFRRGRKKQASAQDRKGLGEGEERKGGRNEVDGEDVVWIEFGH